MFSRYVIGFLPQKIKNSKIIKRIYYENHHISGGATTIGVENFTFWGSNTGAGTFDDLVYDNDEGWTELTVSQNTFDIHTSADEVDPKYITVTNSTSYRYYAFKFADNYGHVDNMAVRRIELQTRDSNVGIGTTSPGVKLDVEGAVKVVDQTTAPVTCTQTLAGSMYYDTSGVEDFCVCMYDSSDTSWKWYGIKGGAFGSNTDCKLA